MSNLTLIDSHKDLLCFFKGEIYIKSQGNSYEANRTHIVTSKKMREYSVPKQQLMIFFLLHMASCINGERTVALVALA